MKRWLLILALLLGAFPTPANAAIAIVQVKFCHISGGLPDVTCTFDSGTGTGHLIVVMMTTHAGAVSSVTDDKSGCSGYTQVPSGQSTFSDAWYCNSSVSGTTVVTAHYSLGVSSDSMGIYEISGQATSSVIDNAGIRNGTSGNPQNGGSVTTATAHTAITSVDCACGATANIVSVSSPFTSDGIDNSGSRGDAIASYLPTSTGTYTPQWSYDTNDTANSTTVAWKEAGGGGPTFPAAIINALVRGGGITF